MALDSNMNPNQANPVQPNYPEEETLDVKQLLIRVVYI